MSVADIDCIVELSRAKNGEREREKPRKRRRGRRARLLPSFPKGNKNKHIKLVTLESPTMATMSARICHLYP